MFKRFTDCHKWQDPWFRKLPMEYKHLWSYICDHCDNAGVWKVDMETASFFIGNVLDKEKALEHLNSRVKVLSEDYWLLTKFVEFQYGVLSSKSPPHIKVLKLIEKHTLALPYPYPSTRVEEEEEEKEVVKEVKDVRDGVEGIPKKTIEKWFQTIWLAYPKERRHGRKVALARFIKSVVTVEDGKRCARALEAYLKSDEVKRGYLMRASKWFDEWEDHANDDRRSGEGFHGADVEQRPDSRSAGSGEQIAATNAVLKQLSDSKRIPQ